MFKVALIGASGLLGRAVAGCLARQTGWQVVQTAFRHARAQQTVLDVRDAQAVDRFVDAHAPDAIVIAAAERRPDVCENDPALARALNVDAVRLLASAARRHRAWVLSISTDYVFDGTRPPYLHDAPPAPINAYGRSKLEGERDCRRDGFRLRAALAAAVWADRRLAGVGRDESGPGDRGVAPRSAAQARAAVMDGWAIRYPTFTPDVAFVIAQMLERHARAEAVCGITQWSGDEPMTKYEIARRLADALRIDAQLTPQPTPVDTTPRPHNCHLDSSVLEALGIGRRTPFDVAIRQVLADFPWRGDAS